MELPEEDPDTINSFVEWLCSHECSFTEVGAHSQNERDAADQRCMELARLYILADKYDIRQLKNTVVQAFCKEYLGPYSLDFLGLICGCLGPKSPFRMLCADTLVFDSAFVRALAQEGSKSGGLSKNPAFTADLATAFARKDQDRWASPFYKGVVTKYMEKEEAQKPQGTSA